MASGKAIIGIVFGILGVICYVCGFVVNEVSRYDTLATVAWCGWDGLGGCAGASCKDTKIFYIEDDLLTTYLEDSFANGCDTCLENDCAACTNKLVGQAWFGCVIGGAVLGGFGVLFLCIPSTRSFGGGCQIVASGAGLVAILAYVIFARDDLECFSKNWEPAASMYAVMIGLVCYSIGGIGSCGASKYD